MKSYERSYETARTIFGFMEFCAWATVIGGGILAVAAFGNMSSRDFGPPPGMLMLIGGIALALGGLAGVVFCQVGRANVDTAEMTRDSLQIARATFEKQFGVKFDANVTADATN